MSVRLRLCLSPGVFVCLRLSARFCSSLPLSLFVWKLGKGGTLAVSRGSRSASLGGGSEKEPLDFRLALHAVFPCLSRYVSGYPSPPVCLRLSVPVGPSFSVRLCLSVCLCPPLAVSVCLLVPASLCLCLSASVRVCPCLCLSLPVRAPGSVPVSVCFWLSLSTIHYFSVCPCLSLSAFVRLRLPLSVSFCLRLSPSVFVCRGLSLSASVRFR